MIYYNYGHDTGAYLGTTGEAHECQREPGVFHLPAWATYEVPPSQDGATAYFADGHWTLRKDPTPEEVVATLGATLAPEEKKHDMGELARANIDAAARHLGFKDTQDALSHIGEETQRGYNADAFKAWRSLAMEAIDKMIARAMSTTEPLPTHHEWNEVLNGIQFHRKIIPIPTISPEFEAHEDYVEKVMLEEAARIEQLVK